MGAHRRLDTEDERVNLTRSVGRALKAGFRYAGFGGGPYGWGYDPYGWWGRTLPGTAYDYRREAGTLWENSAVYCCISWIADNVVEAPAGVRRRVESKWQWMEGHPLAKLLKRPNSYYSAVDLWAATVISYCCDGNAYWYKVRSRAGKWVGCEYVPYYMITPAWQDNGTDFISAYHYRVDGSDLYFPPEDIIHFRNGIDPYNVRKGLAPLRAVLREICTDNEVATFSAALVRNFGIPGAIVSLKEAPRGQTEAPGYVAPGGVSVSVRDKLKTWWREEFTGDGRGGVLVSTLPLDVTNPGFKPSEMLLDKMRTIPETRVASALRIPPVVVGFQAGLERSTYSNMAEAREAAFQNCIVPMHRTFASTLDQEAEMLAPGEEVAWDYSEVRALQEDKNALYERLEKACGGPFMTPDEARSEAGLSGSSSPGGAVLREPRPLLPASAEPNAAQAKKIIGALWRRQVAA